MLRFLGLATLYIPLYYIRTQDLFDMSPFRKVRRCVLPMPLRRDADVVEIVRRQQASEPKICVSASHPFAVRVWAQQVGRLSSALSRTPQRTHSPIKRPKRIARSQVTLNNSDWIDITNGDVNATLGGGCAKAESLNSAFKLCIGKIPLRCAIIFNINWKLRSKRSTFSDFAADIIC